MVVTVNPLVSVGFFLKAVIEKMLEARAGSDRHRLPARCLLLT
jgi:hypothetical protein